MKIALYHNLPSGGARRAVYEIVKRLTARGHTVDEYCPQTADLSFLNLDGCVRRTEIIPLRLRGVSPVRIPLLTPYITAVRLLADLASLERVNRQAAVAINEGKYDVAFTHDCRFTQNPDVLRFLAVPSVHYCHHGARSRLPGPKEVSPSKGDLLKRLKGAYYYLPTHVYPYLRERRAAQNICRAHLVVTNSVFAREGLFRAYGVQSKVVYLGVDVERFRPLGLPRESFILSAGAVHYFKGYRFLISALGRLGEKHRPELVIAANSSDADERRIIESMAARMNVRLTIRRVQDDQEMLQLYNRAAAFVYTPIMEPWGLAIVEAMACGAPVVAVREGGIRESVLDGQTGLLVERDEADFADAVHKILTSSSLAQDLGRNAADYVRQHFTWERTVDRLEQLLDRAI